MFRVLGATVALYCGGQPPNAEANQFVHIGVLKEKLSVCARHIAFSLHAHCSNRTTQPLSESTANGTINTRVILRMTALYEITG